MPEVQIHGASDADDQTGREGDFIVADTAIHCTTAPGDLLMEKCRTNLERGLNPIIVTLHERVEMARQMLEDKGIGHRTEVWDLEQFLSTCAGLGHLRRDRCFWTESSTDLAKLYKKT